MSLMWKLVEPSIGHEAARDALSSALGTLAVHLGEGGAYTAYELFRGCRYVHDVDAFLGRDRTRMLVSDVLELGSQTETGYMGDVVSSLSALVCTLARLGVELDKNKLCRHAMRLLTQPPRRYTSRASSLVAWATCLEEQVRTRERVFEPWPEDPSSLSLRMEVERIERRDSVQDERIRVRAEALADKSYADREYSIRPVASVAEMVEEGERQHNCLATYTEKVASGETDIWLMCPASDPDRSLVTVEMRDGQVRQAFRACNEVPSDAELAWLAKWCAEVGYRMYHGRMRALCA